MPRKTLTSNTKPAAMRPGGAPLAAALVGVALAAPPAQAFVEDAPAPAQQLGLRERVAAVRQALLTSTSGAMAQASLNAQATTWTNWPKWSKWSNWANK